MLCLMLFMLFDQENFHSLIEILKMSITLPLEHQTHTNIANEGLLHREGES